jgi:hypothetical protein
MDDRVTELAEQITQGRNGNKFSELVRMCLPFFRRIKYRFGFVTIDDALVASELAASAVGMGIARWKGGNSCLWICLQNAFRDECRRHVTRESHGNFEKIAEAIAATTEDSAARAEERDSVIWARRELAREDRRCQIVVRLWMKGATYVEIGQQLGVDPDKIKRMRVANLEAIRRRMLKGPDARP